MNDTESQLQKLQELKSKLPEDAKGSSDYPVQMVLFVPTELEMVPDLETGGQRTKRFAALMSLAISNRFSEGNNQGAMFPVQPFQLVDADTKETLRARMIHEIDVALEMLDQ